jgi:hypothetical protein
MVRPKLGPDKLGAGSPLRIEGKEGSFAQLALPVVGSGNAANARRNPRLSIYGIDCVTPTYQLFQHARSNWSIQLINLSLTS